MYVNACMYGCMCLCMLAVTEITILLSCPLLWDIICSAAFWTNFGAHRKKGFFHTALQFIKKVSHFYFTKPLSSEMWKTPEVSKAGLIVLCKKAWIEPAYPCSLIFWVQGVFWVHFCSSSSSFFNCTTVQYRYYLLTGLLPANSVFWPLFPICNFAFTNICLHTIPPSVVWSSSWLTSLRIIVKYLIYFSFTIHSVNMTNPIQLTYSDKWKYI